MPAAIVDLDINEGDTFLMDLEFWEDADNTLPIDITLSTFKGSFLIGTKTIPMTITKIDLNVIHVEVACGLMGDLQKQGRYDIDQMTAGENFRLMQGNVRVNKEVTTCT